MVVVVNTERAKQSIYNDDWQWKWEGSAIDNYMGDNRKARQ
jgi:hypothetical protein